MRRFLPLLLIAIFSLALDLKIPSEMKILESTKVPPLLIQPLLGEYGKELESLEIVLLEGDRDSALRFWNQTLPKEGWNLVFAPPSPKETFPLVYIKGKSLIAFVETPKPNQLLVVRLEGVSDVGALLAVAMKGLTSLATSFAQQSQEGIISVTPFPESKLLVTARIPASAIKERVKKEGGERSLLGSPPGVLASPPTLQKLLENVEEIQFKEYQISSKVSPLDILQHYERELTKANWRVILKNANPMPSLPYVLLLALREDYAIISVLPSQPTKTLTTINEIFLLGERK